MAPRYGQLSYTSFDTVGSRGGWQVKQTSGGITEAEGRRLVSRIDVALVAAEPVPRYPTPAQLKAVPRRLAYHRIDDATAAYWHTAPAGPDSMGRPGNVFAHVLLDRGADVSHRGCRPIELWRSPGWLTPYGAREVAAATLPAQAPEAGGVVTAQSVVAFACDTTTWRLSTLCVVLDAVAAALEDGPVVVLGVESPDVAAQWIGAVSFLMSPGMARRLNFSTLCRNSDLRTAWRIDQHLLAVPRHDLEQLPGPPPGVLVLDEAEPLSVGELHGQNHCTARGQEITVTAWSAMAQVALVNSRSAGQLLADIDEFSAGVPGAVLPPPLPMAVSVLNRSWGEDAVPEAKSVIANVPPTAAVYPGSR